MSMKRRDHLSDPHINALKAKAALYADRQEMADAGRNGLRLRVTPAGVCTWALGCRDAQGQARRFVLGHWPGITLSQAREAARRMRHEVQHNGADPIATKRAIRTRTEVDTLDKLLPHYAQVRRVGLRSWADGERQIRNVFRAHLTTRLVVLTRHKLHAPIATLPASPPVRRCAMSGQS